MTPTFFHLIFAICGTILATCISADSQLNCGMTEYVRRLISRGTETERGEFPFLTALYIIKESRFHCGGTLISSRHVLTAAHCVSGYGFAYRPEEIVVLLGAYDLTLYNISTLTLAREEEERNNSRIERDVVQRDVIGIHIHPDWDSFSDKIDADIAILVLKENVSFTFYIRPVCMPPDNLVVTSTYGTIVGWGLTENGTQPHLKYPKQGFTLALEEAYCYTSDYVAAMISSLRTFCGSGGNSSPNSGDSGGGYFVRHGSAWVQYGVVSSIRSNATGYVDPNSIAIYTNVKEFKTWINDTVRRSGGQVSEASGLNKIQFQLKCHYEVIKDNGSKFYGCFLDNMYITSVNNQVTSFTGSHKDGKTDEDVTLLQFRNGTVHYLPDGIGNIFKNLTRVEILPGLKTKRIRRSNFKNLDHVVRLDIYDTDIETIEEDWFWDLHELKVVKFFYHNSRKFEETSQRSVVNNHQLRRFNRDGNQLEFIPINLLKNNLLLEEAWLSYNNLKVIYEETFVNNHNLKVVNIEGNDLEFIPENLFQNNLLLEEARLSYNNFKTFEEQTFINNHKLKVVNLGGNEIDYFPVDLFKSNLLLETVSLGSNYLKTIDTQAFRNNRNLIKIDISFNQINLISENFFENFSSLEEIQLRQNGLDSVPVNLFKNNLLLETVSLGANRLKSIEAETFANNQKLKDVSLDFNQLEFIPRNLFQNNLLLEEIHLSSNNLNVIDIDFTGFKNIKSIFLDHNRCINGYYYESQNRNLTEFLDEIRAKCTSNSTKQ